MFGTVNHADIIPNWHLKVITVESKALHTEVHC